jgi:hypothetical protein
MSARIAALEAQLAEGKGRLDEIACWSQSQSLLWWQVKAREALSALEATPPAPREPESIRRARKSIFQDQGYAATPPAQKVMECATEGCEQTATVRFERGGVGSDYCRDCYMRVQALPAAQEAGKP